MNKNLAVDTTQRNYLHWFWRWPAFLLWLIVMPMLFFICKLLGLAIHKEIPHYFHRGVRFILGIKVSFTGEQSQQEPTIYISNHISYLDVFVLGSVRAYFMAKSEVASWPVLGQLARFQNTLFIERIPGKARHQLEVMQSHLKKNNNLILFPEGTSTDGTYVEPFKSSLFEAANLDDNDITVAIQPVTIAYTHQAGKQMDQMVRDNYAWYAKMPFTAHFFNLFALKKVGVNIHFHPVCYLDQFVTRKQCAEHCHKLVSEQLVASVT